MILSRRAVLFRAAALVPIAPALAQHTHRAVTDEKTQTGAYTPKCFTAAEYKTLQHLADLIIPAGDGAPGALAGGAPEFIDLLASRNAELAALYTGGLAWLDHEMLRSNESAFADASPKQQAALLDQIAYAKQAPPELAAGVAFFAAARRMVVDAFFTSKPGIEYLGYQGNGALAKFEVPAAALDYALKRSGLA
jgi:hypothetical protein